MVKPVPSEPSMVRSASLPAIMGQRYELPVTRQARLVEHAGENSAKQRGDDVMHAVTRSYSGKGAKELFDVLEKNKPEIRKVMRSIKGFVSYSLVRTEDGGFSISVYRTKARADESVQAAKDWIKQNAADAGARAPKISEGTIILQ